MGEEGSDKVMVLGTFVEDGGIVRGVRAEGDFNEVDGTGCLKGGKGGGVVGFQERGKCLV